MFSQVGAGHISVAGATRMLYTARTCAIIFRYPISIFLFSLALSYSYPLITLIKGYSMFYKKLYAAKNHSHASYGYARAYLMPTRSFLGK